MTSVSVFIDYENTRFGAREVFGDPQRDPYTFGHVRPLRLGLLLKQLGEKVDPARELTAVNVYRGRPGQRAARRRKPDPPDSSLPGRAVSHRVVGHCPTLGCVGCR